MVVSLYNARTFVKILNKMKIVFYKNNAELKLITHFLAAIGMYRNLAFLFFFSVSVITLVLSPDQACDLDFDEIFIIYRRKLFIGRV